jgi:hypothetical protein
MKNKKSLLIGGVLAALLVAVLVGVGARSVYAQTSTPTTPLQGRGPGGGHGGGFSLAGLQIAAQKLGMTTDELITALQSGKTLEQVAQEKGLNIADIQTAIQEANKIELRNRIQQGVTDGTISQDKANWLLEGLDKGYIGNGPDGDLFFGAKHGHGLPPGTNTRPTQPAPAQPSPTQSSSG